MVLTSNTCIDKWQCHTYIRIINNSNSEVMVSIPFWKPTNQCRLDGEVAKSGHFFDYTPFNSCVEDNLKYGSKEIYIVDPKFYNDTTVFYSCDSIEAKNLVLKHYVLTLDDLKKCNFKVVYQ